MKKTDDYNDDSLLDIKTDELLLLLQKGTIGREHVRAIQAKINGAIDVTPMPEKIEAFKELDKEHNRLDMVNDLEFLLAHHQLNSRVSKIYLYQERLKKGVLIGISVTMIVLGLAMIIMPAPPYFEMFTIYYFNKDDGITLMDVISMLIILTGVYLFLNSALKKIVP